MQEDPKKNKQKKEIGNREAEGEKKRKKQKKKKRASVIMT